MDNLVRSWLEANVGKLFASPRNKAFNRRTKDFEIVSISSDRVNIRFVESKYPALLRPWMMMCIGIRKAPFRGRDSTHYR